MCKMLLVSCHLECTLCELDDLAEAPAVFAIMSDEYACYEPLGLLFLGISPGFETHESEKQRSAEMGTIKANFGRGPML